MSGAFQKLALLVLSTFASHTITISEKQLIQSFYLCCIVLIWYRAVQSKTTTLNNIHKHLTTEGGPTIIRWDRFNTQLCSVLSEHAICESHSVHDLNSTPGCMPWDVLPERKSRHHWRGRQWKSVLLRVMVNPKHILTICLYEELLTTDITGRDILEQISDNLQPCTLTLLCGYQHGSGRRPTICTLLISPSLMNCWWWGVLAVMIFTQVKLKIKFIRVLLVPGIMTFIFLDEPSNDRLTCMTWLKTSSTLIKRSFYISWRVYSASKADSWPVNIHLEPRTSSIKRPYVDNFPHSW